MRNVITVLLVAFAAARCGDGSRAQPAATDSAAIEELEPPPRAPSQNMRLDTPAAASANSAVAIPILTAVRTAVHDGNDRIVFEFNGPLPGYKLEYVDRPLRQCGSGDVVELPGDAWLSIRFFPANAHTDEGRPSVAARDLTFTGRNLKQLKLICDFEAVVEWVAAVGYPLHYKVLELQAPDRLAIDLEK